MRRFFLVQFLLVCVFLTCVGCAAVSRSIDNYKACQGDQECLDQMTNVKEVTYAVTKNTATSFPFPSVPETIALVISNVVSFGFGAFRGSKVKR